MDVVWVSLWFLFGMLFIIKYFMFHFFLPYVSRVMYNTKNRIMRSFIIHKLLKLVFSFIATTVLFLGFCSWLIWIYFVEKAPFLCRLLGIISKFLVKCLLITALACAVTFGVQLLSYLPFSNAVVYAAGEHIYDFENFSEIAERVTGSALYKECETEEERMLVFKYLMRPHFRCAILWYISSIYARGRTSFVIRIAFPRWVTEPRHPPTESLFFDLCLDLLEFDELTSIVKLAEAGIPGFSENWVPNDEDYLNIDEPWMRGGPDLEGVGPKFLHLLYTDKFGGLLLIKKIDK